MEECKITNQLDFMRNIFIVIFVYGIKEMLTAKEKTIPHYISTFYWGLKFRHALEDEIIGRMPER